MAKDPPDTVKGKILHLFFDWLLQVFKTSSVVEVREMFMLLTPLEECRPYREIIEIGEKQGIEIGEKQGEKKGIVIGEKRGILLGKIQQIEELFKEKVIQQHYYEAQLALLTKQLNELGS